MVIGAEKTEEFQQELQDTVFHGDIINSDAVEGLQDSIPFQLSVHRV